MPEAHMDQDRVVPQVSSLDVLGPETRKYVCIVDSEYKEEESINYWGFLKMKQEKGYCILSTRFQSVEDK